MLQAIFTQIMMPLNFMGTLMREVDETKVNLAYAVEMIKDKQKNLDSSSNLKLKEYEYKGGEIIFDKVNFSFKGENGEIKEILNNLSCKFEKGTTNALVGHSGSGKTTIFNLIVSLPNIV